MSSITYREIEPSEIVEVASLARQVFDRYVAPHYQPDGVSEFHRYASAEAFLQRQESGHVTLVADNRGQIVGMLHLRKPCHVAMLFVRPSFQRGGVGRGLLAAAEALGGDEEYKLIVNSSPNSVSAYQRPWFHATDSEHCVNGIRFIPMRRQGDNEAAEGRYAQAQSNFDRLRQSHGEDSSKYWFEIAWLQLLLESR